MTEPKKIDRTHVGVVSVESVVHPAKIMLYGTAGDEVREISGLEEVLLSTGQVIYRCARDPENCDYTAETGRPVVSHFRVHSANTKLKQATKELAALKAKAEQQRQNRSNGQKKAAATKIVQPKAPKPDSTSETYKNINADIDNALAYVNEARTTMTIVAKTLDQLARDLKKLAPSPSAIDVGTLSPDEKLALLRKLVG